MRIILPILAALAAPAYAQYSGAIAYSPSTGAYGYVRQAQDPDQASYEAMSACPAADCEVVVWATDACAALAAGYPASVYGSAWNQWSRQDAVTAAMYECSLRGDGCRVVASLCTYWGR